MIGNHDWLMGYIMGKVAGTKEVEINSEDLVFTDDGEGNITISEANE